MVNSIDDKLKLASDMIEKTIIHFPQFNYLYPFTTENIDAYLDYFDLTRITDASYMFAKCNSLKEITLKNDGKESSNINIKSIFNGDYALERVNLNNFNKKIITAIDYAFNDGNLLLLSLKQLLYLLLIFLFFGKLYLVSALFLLILLYI